MHPLLVDIECVGLDTVFDFLEPVEAPANYKDPQKIAEYIIAGKRKQIERAALDPDLCRIVAIGHGDATGNDHVIICQTEDDEANALEALWARVTNSVGVIRPLITFSGFRYDLPVLMRRSQYLGVDYPLLNLDKFRSPHIDLYNRLTFNGLIDGHALSFYAARFGMPIEDAITGAQIGELVKAGDWSSVESHCRSDLTLMRFIAQKLRLIPMPERVAA